MELLGENLSDLKRRQEGQHFSMLTTLVLAKKMLIALREVHESGYIHRDIKPGNFVLGSKKKNQQREIIILDFGLSKKYLRRDGTIIPKKKEVRWVGSRRYMSINTHDRKEQSRRDDMWSLLYVLVEFATGGLPWGHLRGIENLDKVREIKEEFQSLKLVEGLPDIFSILFDHVSNLKYSTCPDYDKLFDLIQAEFESLGGNEDTPYDWETPEDVATAKKMANGLSMSQTSEEPSTEASSTTEREQSVKKEPVAIQPVPSSSPSTIKGPQERFNGQLVVVKDESGEAKEGHMRRKICVLF
eukprot:TRINITY_DN8546_c0_g1_i2.p1 TRINITY_DN8546_c0_g1~~TRINITY_DN8546_c0_g1_i2.p1  ORF type:complete len:300 (-),score=89.29 TRINITY_DN8546_c0_g1_i2:72-971(-)